MTHRAKEEKRMKQLGIIQSSNAYPLFKCRQSAVPLIRSSNREILPSVQSVIVFNLPNLSNPSIRDPKILKIACY
jgi:hypothetical protein